MCDGQDDPSEDKRNLSNSSDGSLKRPSEEAENGSMSDKIYKMMANMGHAKGSGLGRHSQGLVDPVELKQQIGRRGLGCESLTRKINEFKRTIDMEIVSVQEDVRWLDNETTSNYSYDILEKWMVLDNPKLTMEDEINFCDPQLLQEVLKAKTLLDEFDKQGLQEARCKANPFEKIRSAFFMNRAALKMANIDAATNFMFTNVDNNPFHKKRKGPFYFADVCAGPGGFTEYILWRKKWAFKGFGLTLKESYNDFKVDDSTCASGATFQPLYGAKGDGDIFYPQNIEHFRDAVLHDTENSGVHFIMCDGGFSVDGNENLQEILSKQLYICQCLMGLEIIRPHGHFMSKMFDVFTPFSVGLLYLMYLSFERITILKPNASRPANSERYLICYGLKKSKQTDAIRKYMRKIVYKLHDIKQKSILNDKDIQFIVPLEEMKKDAKFTQFITYCNNRIGHNQVIALIKMATFCENPKRMEPRQENLRARCLEYWNIPDKPKNYIPAIGKEHLTYLISQEVVRTRPKYIEEISEIEKILKDFNDWCFVPMFSKKEFSTCKFYAATTGCAVYKYDRSKWIKEKDVHLRLAPGTILYGEIVDESALLKQEDMGEVASQSLHVIDAYRLGGTSLADLPFEERQDLITTYCQAINFECNKDTIRIRSKPIFPLESLMKDSPLIYDNAQNEFYIILPTLGKNVRREYFLVNSLLLLKTNSTQDFRTTYVLRKQIFRTGNNENKSNNILSLDDFLTYIKKYSS